MIRISLTALAAAAFIAAPAAAEPFALFVYETPSDFAARDDATLASGYWAAYGELGQAMAAAGIVRAGAPLNHPSAGARVSVRNGQAQSQTIDVTGETLSGWFLIDVADLAAAEAWAARIPAARTARVEVRAVLDVPMSK